jgi:thiol-disulfide isomerase/thioredoxin
MKKIIKAIIIVVILALLMPFAYKGAKKLYYSYLAYEAKKYEGRSVLNISGKDISGKRYNLNDFKGKNIVIVFWATWCKTCIEEMPKINKFYKNLDKNTILISSLADKNLNKAKELIKLNSIKYPVIVDKNNLGMDGEFNKFFKITHTPSIWVIDKNGTIIAQNLLHIDEVSNFLK